MAAATVGIEHRGHKAGPKPQIIAAYMIEMVEHHQWMVFRS
jgi:hypothetical protein